MVSVGQFTVPLSESVNVLLNVANDRIAVEIGRDDFLLRDFGVELCDPAGNPPDAVTD